MRAQYQHNLCDYEAVFGVGVRQLKKWIAVGKSANPPELPPLDDPPLIVAWWNLHMQVRVPQKLLHLAVDAAKNADSSTSNSRLACIDVKNLDVTLLNALNQARGYLAAVDQKLSAAYRDGDEDSIRRWQGPWERAMETVRKAEAADLLRQKAAGQMLSKSEVLAELANFLTILKVMRSSMARRIIRRLGFSWDESLRADPKWKQRFEQELGAAIDAERITEESFLRRLSTFRSVDHFELELESAQCASGKCSSP